MSKRAIVSISLVAGLALVSCGDDDNGEEAGGVTAVLAGAGLSGGGTSGSVTVQADFSAVQGRVEGACTGATSMQTIDEQGAATCTPAFTGINNTECADDSGYLIIGNPQPEFGCHQHCDDMCAKHGMTCEYAYTVAGVLRTCTSINNNGVLYCWCKQ